ncbi:MAG: Crp/Fnr family transcriptional regulator [Candidatus Muiribacteriaceae bacterium]
MKKLLLKDIRPGMVIGKPVMYKDQLLVRMESLITHSLLELFQKLEIKEIFIKEDKIPEPAASGKSDLVEKKIRKGDYICLQNQISKFIYVLISGEVEIVYNREYRVTGEVADSTGEVLTRLKGENVIFGEIGAILGIGRTASVRATTDSVVRYISLKGRALIHTILNNPTLGINLSVSLARRVNETNRKILLIEELFQYIKDMLEFNLHNYLKFAQDIKAIAEENKYEDWLVRVNRMIRRGKLYNDVLNYDFNKEGDDIKCLDDSCNAGKGELICRVRNIREFHRDDIICRQGQLGSEMYILVSGIVDVYIGDERVNTIARQGEVMGETAVLLGYNDGNYGKRSATLKAVSYTQLIVIPGFDLEKRFEQEPTLIAHIAKQLSERLPVSNDMYLKLRRILEKKLRFMDMKEELDGIYELFAENHDQANQLCPSEYRYIRFLRDKATLEKEKSQKFFENIINKVFW